jgi:lipopolysaccharide/colanic/teichoic acid biosynthesis glycosyltransferase
LSGANRYERWSRALDVAVSLPALIILAPLFALIAAAVVVGSGRPVFYRGVRVGRRGQPFGMLKFRTMVRNADRLGTSVTRESDARVTPVGRFLRRWKLDELPQLWNVVRGEMAVVGPRPDAPEVVETYTGPMRRALEVRPGLTSLASLRLRNETELLRGVRSPEVVYERILVPAKVELALEHVRRRSIAFDWRIVAATAGAWLGLRRADAAEHEFLADLRRQIVEHDSGGEFAAADPVDGRALGQGRPGSGSR